MDVTQYVEQLRADLVSAASAGGEAMVEAASRLSSALDASARMALLEALSDAAAEITSALDGTVVEVRLKGRQPQFVVEVTDGAASATHAAAAPDDVDDDDETIARITLRLPEGLKQRAEEAASHARQSLNTWLVDAVRHAMRPADEPRGRRGVGRQLSGWAR